MKRSGCLVLLMLLSSSAHADTFSFVVAGYRIRFEAPRHCGSPSCVSVSVPGIHATHRRERKNAPAFAPAPDVSRPVAPELALAPPAAPPTPLPGEPANQPASQPANQPANQPAREAAVEPPAPAPAPTVPAEAPPPDGAAKQATAPAPPSPPTPDETEGATKEPAKPEVTSPATMQVVQANESIQPPASAQPVRAEQVAKASRESDPPAPLGDWRTDGDKGLVRIQPCGKALCGYALDASSDTIGESVLVNMKPETASLWSGSIYSRASGVTYYGTIAAMKGANSLWVEACALGRFFCSGKVWSRVAPPQQQMLSSKTAQEPRS